jgi:nucleoid-associated protein YgaU
VTAARVLASAILVAGLGLARAGPAQEGVHVVAQGETLWQIAAALTGNPHRWPELYRANRDQIKDPSLLYPGQRLAIPDLASPDGGGGEGPSGSGDRSGD